MTSFDGSSYQARFDALAASGMKIHGEADLVRSYGPATVLDAGCGTGRVATELASHGIDTVGVDVDASMLAEARRRAPGLEWLEADVSRLALGRRFDVVVMAGNVPLFCPERARSDLIGASAAHVASGGRLISGFQTDRGYDLDSYDRAAGDAGLVLEDRWSSWDRVTFDPAGGYAVSVHRRPDTV